VSQYITGYKKPEQKTLKALHEKALSVFFSIFQGEVPVKALRARRHDPKCAIAHEGSGNNAMGVLTQEN
jgi:hypothetical protein